MIGAETVSDFRQVCANHTDTFTDLRDMGVEIKGVVSDHADSIRDLWGMYREFGEHPNEVIRYTALGLLGIAAVGYATTEFIKIGLENKRETAKFKKSVREGIASL